MKRKKVKHKLGRVLWAVDPFEADDETRLPLSPMIHRLLESGLRVEPVYVMSPDQFEMHTPLSEPWSRKLKPKASVVLENAMKRTLSGYKGLKMDKPMLLIEKQPSLSRSVKALSTYAKKSGAEFIVLGTHSKSGLSRVMMGSFAEELLLYSRTPVLLVPSQSIPNEKPEFKNVLVPTELGLDSESFLKQVFKFAKKNDSVVTLFHRTPHQIEPFLKLGVYLIGGGSLSFPEFMSNEEQKKRQYADRLVQMGIKMGVEVKVEFAGGEGETSQAILQRASHNRSDLIIMATQKGVVATTVLGSVTRQVVRAAPCPIWIMHGA